jgi:Ni,Fe-hydrogenase III small subunit
MRVGWLSRCRALRSTAKALRRDYEDMPAPKLVFAIGSCACGGGIWHDTYSVLGPVEKVVPVDFFIPGCPPRPEAILYGIAVAVGLVDKKVSPVKVKQLEFPIPRYHPDDLQPEGEMVVYRKQERV